MRFLHAFLFLITYTSVHAQIHISGHVNTSTNQPLQHAIVALHGIGVYNDSTNTDANGAFSFSQLKPDTYTLSTSVPGYQNTVSRFNISKDTVINLVLDVSGIELSEVAVSGAKSTIQNTAGKTVYNVSASITARGSDVLTAIGQVPGIKVNTTEISIAGKGGVKVMINNRIIELSGNDLIRYLQSISADQVATIELIKNPAANYDAEGNAGLIRIILKESKAQGYSGSIQFNAKSFINDPYVVYGTSSYGSISPTANLNYNSGSWSVFASANIDEDHHLEGFETDLFYPDKTSMQTDTGVYRHHAWGLMGGLDYKLSSRTTIGIAYQGGNSTYDGFDHVNNPFYNLQNKLDSTAKTLASYHPVARTNSINLHTNINFDTTGKKLLLNADYFNNYRTDRSNFETNSYFSDGSINPLGKARYYDTNKQDISVYTLKADVELPTNFAKLSFGGKLSFINNSSNAYYYNKSADNVLLYNSNLSNAFKYKENTEALYFSAERDFDKWKYQLGLRAEITQTDGYSYTLEQNTINNYVKLFPSVLLSYEADKDNTFAFTYGRRINRPSFWSLNPFKSLFTAYSYGEGNPYLQPEYNSNLELSHTYKTILTSSLFLNVTDNGFNNVTIARADTNLVYTTPINFMTTYRYGLSESLSLHLFTWLDNSNLVTFYHINALSAISSISNNKGYGAYFSTTNNIYLNKEKTFGAALNFWYQFPEIENVGSSDAYYKFDLGIKGAAFQKKLDISLVVNDVFGKSATAVSSTINGIKQKFTNFQLNRYVQLGLSYRFGSGKSVISNTGNQEEKSRI